MKKTQVQDVDIIVCDVCGEVSDRDDTLLVLDGSAFDIKIPPIFGGGASIFETLRLVTALIGELALHRRCLPAVRNNLRKAMGLMEA